MSTEKSSFFLDIFSHTHNFFVLAFYHFLWVEYGPVCDALVLHQACQGGHFLGRVEGTDCEGGGSNTDWYW